MIKSGYFVEDEEEPREIVILQEVLKQIANLLPNEWKHQFTDVYDNPTVLTVWPWHYDKEFNKVTNELRFEFYNDGTIKSFENGNPTGEDIYFDNQGWEQSRRGVDFVMQKLYPKRIYQSRRNNMIKSSRQIKSARYNDSLLHKENSVNTRYIKSKLLDIVSRYFSDVRTDNIFPRFINFDNNKYISISCENRSDYAQGFGEYNITLSIEHKSYMSWVGYGKEQFNDDLSDIEQTIKSLTTVNSSRQIKSSKSQEEFENLVIDIENRLGVNVEHSNIFNLPVELTYEDECYIDDICREQNCRFVPVNGSRRQYRLIQSSRRIQSMKTPKNVYLNEDTQKLIQRLEKRVGHELKLKFEEGNTPYVEIEKLPKGGYSFITDKYLNNLAEHFLYDGYKEKQDSFIVYLDPAIMYTKPGIKSAYTREDYDRFDEMGNFIPYKPTSEELAKKDEIKTVLEQELSDAYEPDPMDDYVGYDSTNERIDMACERVAKQFGVDTDFVEDIAGEIQNEDYARTMAESEWIYEHCKDKDKFWDWQNGEDVSLEELGIDKAQMDREVDEVVRKYVNSSRQIKSSLPAWAKSLSDDDAERRNQLQELYNEAHWEFLDYTMPCDPEWTPDMADGDFNPLSEIHFLFENAQEIESFLANCDYAGIPGAEEKLKRIRQINTWNEAYASGPHPETWEDWSSVKSSRKQIKSSTVTSDKQFRLIDTEHNDPKDGEDFTAEELKDYISKNDKYFDNVGLDYAIVDLNTGEEMDISTFRLNSSLIKSSTVPRTTKELADWMREHTGWNVNYDEKNDVFVSGPEDAQTYIDRKGRVITDGPSGVENHTIEEFMNIMDEKPIKSALDTVKVTFDNGDTIVTDYNADVGREEIAKYYMHNYFNVGGEDEMHQVVKVEFPGNINSARTPEVADMQDAEDLALFAENDHELYDMVIKPTFDSLQRKLKRGIYDKDKALIAWEHVIDEAAKAYDRQLGSKRGTMTMFNKATRKEAAKILMDSIWDEDEWQA